MRLKVHTFRVGYLYVLVRTKYVLFCSFLYQLSIISRRYIPCTYWFWLSTYCEYRAPAGPSRFALRAIQAPGHTLNQITRKHWQVYSLLLGSNRAWAPGRGRWRLAGGSAMAGQLCSARRRHGQQSAHPQQQPQPATQCAVQTGVSRTWASRWGVKRRQ